ncbi:MAG: TlpA family protein disulfide reductase [Leadbetterella sp.]|nr:TlpA family protein disulfide reductase [Leadbetterella sp.]
MKRILILALMAGMASCISKNDEQQEESAVVTEAPAAQPSGSVAFTRLDGQNTDLSTLGGKVVVLNFWATWCPPCIREMPSLQALYNKYQGNPNVEFLVVEVDNKPDLAKAFVEKHNFTFPVYSPAGMIPEAFLGQAIPTTVILNKKGEISYRHEGMSDFMADDFLGEFEGILNQ